MKQAPLYGGYELGKAYLCSYWRQTHTITHLHPPTDTHGWFVTSLWDDGHSTTHCTALSKRDKVLVPSL